jgi:hypothetical protein
MILHYYAVDQLSKRPTIENFTIKTCFTIR